MTRQEFMDGIYEEEFLCGEFTVEKECLDPFTGVASAVTAILKLNGTRMKHDDSFEQIAIRVRAKTEAAAISRVWSMVPDEFKRSDIPVIVGG